MTTEAKYIEVSPDRLEPVEQGSSENFIEVSPDRVDSGESDSENVWRDLYQSSKWLLRPTVEGLAMTGGAVFFSPGGPFGVVAGGALGFATADQAFEYLDEVFGVKEKRTATEGLISGGKSLKRGAEYALGGEILGATGQLAYRGAKALGEKTLMIGSPSTLKKKAGKILTEQGTELTAEQIALNSQLAKQIENKIPGLKFTRGQITNDAQAMSLERSLIRSGTKIDRGGFKVGAKDLDQEQKAFAEKALQDYYNQKLKTGGNLEDFKTVLTNEKDALEKSVKESSEAVDVELSRLTRTMGEEEISPIMHKRLVQKRTESKKEAERLYNEIPDEKLGSEKLNNDLSDIIADEDGIIEPRTEKMISLIKSKTLEKKEIDGKVIEVSKDVGYQTLRKIRSRIGRNIREAASGPNPKSEDARQLSRLQKAVDKAMDQIVETTPSAKTAYEKAQKYYATVHVPRFKQGTVADVLARGVRGEETKIATSMIASKFFTKDAIDDYYRVFGRISKDETIIAPAIKLSDGTVVSGPYSEGGHTAIVNTIDDNPELKRLYDAGGWTEGGWTHKGTFVEKKPDVDISEIMNRTVGDVEKKLILPKGDDIANAAMIEYAHFDLFNRAYNPYNGELDIRKAMGWLHKNQVTLKKIGIYDDLSKAVKSGKDFEVNQKALDTFNKSMAAEILNAQPSKFVSTAFGKSKNYAQTAQDLLALAKRNKAAEKGIKDAVVDHILDSSQLTAEGFFTDTRTSVHRLTNAVKKYLPALRVLYKGEPEKLKAILRVQKAYKIMNRTAGPITGSGSETFEHFQNMMTGLGGARVSKYYFIINLRKVVKSYIDEEVNKYLLRATFDPEYAMNLESLARASVKQKGKFDPRKPTQFKEIERFKVLMKRLLPEAVGESFRSDE